MRARPCDPQVPRCARPIGTVALADHSEGVRARRKEAGADVGLGPGTGLRPPTERHCPWAAGVVGWGAQKKVFASGDLLNGQARSLPGGLTFRSSGPLVHLQIWRWQIWQDGKHACLIPLDNARKMRPARPQPHAVWYQGTLCPSLIHLHMDIGFSSEPQSGF